MKQFFRFYGWGMQMKLHMALYAVALLFFKCVVCLLMGEKSVEVAVILEMIAAAFLFAVAESFLFPAGLVLARSVLAFRTVIWVAVCNLLFAGGAMALHWYPGLPLWGGWLLLLVLELGLAAMWFGTHVVLRIQTAELNRSLREYQNHH